MLGAWVLAVGAVASPGYMNVTNATTPEDVQHHAQTYFDFVNLGYFSGPQVNTTGGTVQGVSHKDEKVDIFWNIPFAANTTGAGRFAAPTDAAGWEGVHKAHWPPKWCPQMRVDGFFFGDEDCLALNVFRPRGTAADAKLPVMVWIYGGAFVIGDSLELGWYNGKHLTASQQVIVVTLNYRVASLGFLALDALKQEQGTAGNWGLLDQQKALQWVKSNIAAFGGDAGKVTIFGESAGGCSVVGQLAMPSSRGLFAAAIAESPLSASDISWSPWKNASYFGQAWAESVGCGSTKSQLECLRGLPLKKALSPLLLTNLPAGTPPAGLPLLLPLIPWWPVVDGTTIPASPLDQASRGELTDVPLMLGTNQNEGSIFLPMMKLITNGSAGYPLTNKTLTSALEHFFNASVVAKILAEYPLSTGGDIPFRASRVAGHVLRDWFFTCAGRRVLRAMNTAGRKSATYMYHFEYDMKGVLHAIAGDYHTSEISFVFDNPWLAHTYPVGTWNKHDKKLAAEMGSYWASFAKGAGSAAPLDHIECTAKSMGVKQCKKFPKYTVNEAKSGSDEYMVFEKKLHTAKGLFEEQCDFWDTQVGYQGVTP